MADMDDKDRSRERTRRDRPTRFSEGSRERDRSPDRGKDRGGMKSSNCRVYVSNIPYEYRWQDLKDLFRSQVGDVAFVELFVDENDKPRGCGIVEFSDPQSVKKCLEVMHRFELKGRKIVIKEDFGNSRDKYGNLIGSGGKRARDRDDSREFRSRDDRRGGFDGSSVANRSNSDGIENKWGNTYGLSPQFLESLWINTPLCNRVFIANLDYNVDKKKLKEVFRLAGKVQRVDLSIDKDGRSRGFAIVEYDHPVESVQAISMFHNQQLYDRVMTVRMDRANETVKLPEGLKGIGMGLGQNGEPLKDVARNLPSNNSSNSNNATAVGGGAGILGAVPAPALQMGISGAFGGLNSVVGSSTLGGLGTTNAVLQAANLAGVGGLSGNLLGGADLNLATGLVSNSLVQNPSLAALTANSGSLGNNSLSNANSLGGSFGRGDASNSGFGNQNSSQNQGFGSGRLYNNDSQKNNAYNYGGGDREVRTGNTLFSTQNNSNQLMRVGPGSANTKTTNFSNKILISNLPPTASYKMLSEKCNEFGDVQRVEDKGNGSVLIVYSSDWEAERAIKNMDRARIDGRTIDVRFF